MGSLVLQFRTVAEIWRVKVGPYAHFFRKMYGKIPKKLRFCILKNSENGNNSPKTHFLELKMDMGLEGNNLKIFTHRIFDFLIFRRDMTHFPRKKSIFDIFALFSGKAIFQQNVKKTIIWWVNLSEILPSNLLPILSSRECVLGKLFWFWKFGRRKS